MSRRVKILLIMLIAAVVWVVCAPLLATRLIVEKPMDKADAILVLGGSATYIERTRVAAELYKMGIASRVFLTDDGERAGWSKTEQRNTPYFELAKRSLRSQGVPEEAIKILPGEVTGTDWEARVLAKEIETSRLKSVLLVTSAYHSRRALWTFEKFLSGKDVSIGIEHAPTGEQTPGPRFWWLSPRGWQMVAGEYVKSAVYWMYY
jgi:uncharacterized SAM-binding protein YcdF (DUF218 family)